MSVGKKRFSKNELKGTDTGTLYMLWNTANGVGYNFDSINPTRAISGPFHFQSKRIPGLDESVDTGTFRVSKAWHKSFCWMATCFLGGAHSGSHVYFRFFKLHEKWYTTIYVLVTVVFLSLWGCYSILLVGLLGHPYCVNGNYANQNASIKPNFRKLNPFGLASPCVSLSSTHT